MKKKILLVLLVMFMTTGCLRWMGRKEEKIPVMEPNASIGSLGYYIPPEYTYRADLRGLLYSENEKKVYINGDYDNDPNNVISVVTLITQSDKGSKQYTDEINAKLTEEDVKYSIKPNGKITEIYARENYKIGENINYAYIMDYAGYIYLVNIKAPSSRELETRLLAKDLYLSLRFNK